VADNDETFMPQVVGQASDIVAEFDDVIGLDGQGFVAASVAALVGDGNLESRRN